MIKPPMNADKTPIEDKRLIRVHLRLPAARLPFSATC
jgi:hypothetical protein